MSNRRGIDVRIVNPLLGTDLVPLPTYATSGAAAIDLRACIEFPVTIEPTSHGAFKTGIAIDMRDPGLVAIVASRSGLALKHSIRVTQGIGVIDSDYHGEIVVLLSNDGKTVYTVQPGDRIAQLLFMPVVQVNFEYVEAFKNETDRGEGGFGSTGLK